MHEWVRGVNQEEEEEEKAWEEGERVCGCRRKKKRGALLAAGIQRQDVGSLNSKMGLRAEAREHFTRA